MELPTASDLIRAALALDTNRLRALLDAGADVAARSAGGRTALHAAASAGSIDAAQLLLDAGAEVDPRDWQGETPLHHAARYGRGGDLEDPDPEFRVVLSAKPRKLHPDLATAIFAEVRARVPGLPPSLKLEDALPAGTRPAVVAELLRMMGRDGQQALYDALQRSGVDLEHIDPVFAHELRGKPGCLAVARLLLERRADPRVLSDVSASPLQEAAGLGEPEMIALLARYGADLDGPGEGSQTPVGTAVEYRRLDLLDALLSAGARLESDQLLPLHLAAGMGSNVELIARLIARGVAIDRRDAEGNTPLMFVAAAGDVKSLEVLLEAGADPHAQNQDGLTALHFAAREGALESAEALVRAGADVNARARDGRTPLHVFVDGGSEFPEPEIPRLLAARGADFSLRDAAGRTPVDAAAQHGYPTDFLDGLRREA